MISKKLLEESFALPVRKHFANVSIITIMTLDLKI